MSNLPPRLLRLIQLLRPRIWLSFLLLTLTFEPFNFWPFAFVALIPWLEEMTESKDWKVALRQSLGFSFIFSLVAFSWITYVLRTFGGLPFPLAVICLLAFAWIAEPQIYILGPWFQFLGKRMARSHGKFQFMLYGLSIAFSYTAVDILFPKLFTDTLGHALIHSTTLVQIADLGGPALLTFLCALGNVALWQAYRKLRLRTEPSVWGSLSEAAPVGLFFIAAMIASMIYGKNRIHYYNELIAKPERTLQMAVIQANIGDIDKLMAERSFTEASRKVMDTYFSMSDEALLLKPKPQVLLWPETAFPSTFKKPESPSDEVRDHEVTAYVESRNVPLFFGGYDRDSVGNSYNSTFLLEPGGRLQTYSKSILIMFGEFIPGADWIPGLKKAFPMVGYFGRGPGSVTRDLLGVPVQPVICYEVLFPNFVLDAVRKGSKVLMNFTNDSWFGDYGAPFYHFKFAALRAVEARIPEVRTTNTGFSALILPTGEVTSRTELFRPEVANLTVPIISAPPTLMVRWGDWFGHFAAAMILVLLFVAKISSPRRKSGHSPVSSKTL